MVFNTTFNNISVILLQWDEEGSIESNQKLCELVLYDTPLITYPCADWSRTGSRSPGE